jgi:hypothetical protein
MNDSITHTIWLVITIGFWLYGSFPLLRYTLLMSEGKFNIRLVLWLLLMVIAIFFMKHSLVSLIQWPVPGSWPSRLFFGMMLFLSVPVPFVWEYLKQIFRRKK